MDVDKLSAINEKVYSFMEKLPEYPTIEIMRQAFRLLPFENLTDYDIRDERLKTVLKGPTRDTNLELENPVILAAGYSEPYMLEKALKMGFGAVTAKCSKEPIKGSKGRTIIRTPKGPLNSIGYKNPGMVATREHIEDISGRVSPTKGIILQISDSSIGNYCSVIDYMDDVPIIRAFEISSCWNSPENERLDFFDDYGLSMDLCRETRKYTRKPLILKLPRAGDCPGMYKTIKIALDNGFTVLNYGNTKRVKDRRFRSGEGGRSGPGLYHDTLTNAYGLHKEFGNYADIIGTGGIDSPYRAREIKEKGHAKALSYITAFPGNIFLARQINEFLRTEL